ncbi:MAG: T9SS type A sorting domain-containing protein [Bacteroidales bacterium]|nr:T9SS type A sorting domain-containing protein [Bacteroidales bacterium]
MKKVLFILLICLITLSSKISYSQVNKSIVDTTKQWNTFRHNGYRTGAYTIINKIGEDTIVDNKIYKKVYTNNYCIWGDTLMNNWTCNHLIREDSNIVYLYLINNNNASGEEIIIYNFNLNVGDEFNEPIILGGEYNGLFMESNAVVDIIDSVEVNGILLKRIIFNIYDTETMHFRFAWIEGIGNTYGLLESGYLIDAGYSSLLCVKQGEDYIYSNTDSDCFITYGLDEIEIDKEIKVYPTLIDKEINISSDKYPISLSVIDLFGREVLRKEIYNNRAIDLDFLKKGTYILKLKHKDTIINRKIIKK